MNELHKDTDTYNDVKRNPLRSLQSKVNNILLNFNDNNYLDFNYDKNCLTQTNTVIPRAYGLPKIHKLNYLLRPIISTINSPIHFLSKLIDSEIKNCLNRRKSYISNSLVLKNELANIFIPQGYILVSLDVRHYLPIFRLIYF